VRPVHEPQRQALAVGRDVPALDGRRDGRAERQFRKVIGYRDLVTLCVAIEKERERETHSSTPDRGGGYHPQRAGVNGRRRNSTASGTSFLK